MIILIEMSFRYLIIVLFAGQLFAQKISGRILTDKEGPVSDVRIGVENENVGDITDKTGSYTLDITDVAKSKVVKVEISGYEPFRMNLSDFLVLSDHTILLKNKSIEIPNIEVISKKYVTKNFGTKNSKRAYGGYNSDKPERLFREYAIKVKNNKRIKIKNINISLAYFSFEQPAAIIFDVQDSINDLPGESQVNETLKLTFTKDDIKNNTLSLDVSDKNIWIDQDFFVSFRVSEDFKGELYFGGNIFAFSKNTYYRTYFGEWQKYSSGEPSINVDVLMEK